MRSWLGALPTASHTAHGIRTASQRWAVGSREAEGLKRYGVGGAVADGTGVELLAHHRAGCTARAVRGCRTPARLSEAEAPGSCGAATSCPLNQRLLDHPHRGGRRPATVWRPGAPMSTARLVVAGRTWTTVAHSVYRMRKTVHCSHAAPRGTRECRGCGEDHEFIRPSRR